VDSSPSTPVNRCVCHDVPFADLIRAHRETGSDFPELQRQTRCGTSCGLCIPYIRAALRTGCAAFPVLSESDLENLA
jgi:NAD(P)H-nitrite reductase large subunit